LAMAFAIPSATSSISPRPGTRRRARGRVSDVVVDLAAPRAGRARRDTLHERVGLAERLMKPSKMNPVSGVAFEFLLDQAYDDLAGTGVISNSPQTWVKTVSTLLDARDQPEMD